MLNTNAILKIKYIQKGPTYIHKIIIPEQIVENPDFKPILGVKESPTFCDFYAAPIIFACSLLSL